MNTANKDSWCSKRNTYFRYAQQQKINQDCRTFEEKWTNEKKILPSRAHGVNSSNVERQNGQLIVTEALCMLNVETGETSDVLV